MLRKEQRLETHLLAFARDGRGVGSLFVSKGQNADFHDASTLLILCWLVAGLFL